MEGDRRLEAGVQHPNAQDAPTPKRMEKEALDDKGSSSVTDYQFILKRYWGYNGFRGIQREIIESIASGKDTLGLMPTGGGKSITFQVPAMAMPGTCIVITPLISLMKDQVDHLRQRDIKAYAIYSGLSRREIVTILENCIYGQVKFLYVSPERLSSELFQIKLKKINVSFITVDEAHCISQWGYDFRPSYLEIAKIRELLATRNNPPILALTATATPSVVDDIQERLLFSAKNVFRMSFVRKNLTYVVRTAADKQAELIHILKSMNSCAIVYTRSRQRTKEIAQLINQQLPPAPGQTATATFYHAGLEPAVKDQRQEAWQRGEIPVMVATNAFGMGIDKADVRLVAHMDIPNSLEAYFQEAGRAGRDGQRAYAVLLYNNSDEARLRKRIDDTFPPKEFIQQVYEQLAYFYQIGVGSGRGHTFEFNADRFCMTYRHFPIRVDAALQLLHLSGYIHYEPYPDTAARLRFLLTRNDLYRLEEGTAEETAVITALLRTYGGLFVDYAYIDESYIAQEAGLDRMTTYQTLKALHNRHILDFIPRKAIPLITYTRDREDGKDIIIPSHVYEQRRAQFQRRIEAVINYAANDQQCRSRQLVAYFGEENADDCGHCDVCLANGHHRKEEKQHEAEARREILQLLADKQPHHISELQQVCADTPHLDAALHELLAEECLQIEGSFIYRR